MPRPLNDQVVVITGASSGIGRETALQFGKHGAAVALAARNEAALREVAQEIGRLGGRAYVVPTDVSEWSQVDHLARTAVERFGRIDTWVNNAAVSVYATVEETTIEEIDRVVQVNLLGQIYGMKAALPYLRQQGSGTIINVSSALAERSVPLQAAYCATKHGIKGFTEALRLELEREHSGIAVTLVLPGSINTPLFRHARSKLGVAPTPIPPIYEPRAVTEAILFAATHKRRDVTVGGAGKLLPVLERISPPLVDWYMNCGDRMVKQQKTARPDDGVDNLVRPVAGCGSTTGDFGTQSMSSSFYTRHLELHPVRQRVVLGAALVGLVALVRRVGR